MKLRDLLVESKGAAYDTVIGVLTKALGLTSKAKWIRDNTLIGESQGGHMIFEYNHINKDEKDKTWQSVYGAGINTRCVNDAYKNYTTGTETKISGVESCLDRLVKRGQVALNKLINDNVITEYNFVWEHVDNTNVAPGYVDDGKPKVGFFIEYN